MEPATNANIPHPSILVILPLVILKPLAPLSLICVCEPGYIGIGDYLGGFFSTCSRKPFKKKERKEKKRKEKSCFLETVWLAQLALLFSPNKILVSALPQELNIMVLPMNANM